ncbi:MAG: molybdopterin molybdotransferase MoeA, partial [Actinomycetota bacterium]
MLTVDEARKRVLEAVAPLEQVDVVVADALGMVVATDLVAPHPLPRFDNSAMDGYALRGSDGGGASEGSPVELEVLGEVRAGDPGDIEVRPGTAARIMTGAPIPGGADAVVPVEETEEREGRVLVKAATGTGRHVRPAGDDIERGAVVVRAGIELGPGELALLASLGLSPVPVHRRPRVAVLVTGDELVPPEATPGPGQIRDSNSVALKALVESNGADAVPFESVPDTREAVVDAFARAAELADVVVSSGGVAVG